MGRELLSRDSAVSPETLKKLRRGIGPCVGPPRLVQRRAVLRGRRRGALWSTGRSRTAECDREADPYMP